MPDLLAESARYLAEVAISDHDPRMAAITAAAGGEVMAFDAMQQDYPDLVKHAFGPFIRWLMSDECDEELAAELLKSRPGALDLTAAREQVRAVLNVLYEVLEPQYPVPV